MNQPVKEAARNLVRRNPFLSPICRLYNLFYNHVFTYMHGNMSVATFKFKPRPSCVAWVVKLFFCSFHFYIGNDILNFYVTSAKNR